VLIDDLMPTFDVSERHHTLALAPADRTYEAARRLDLARSRVIRGLFAARGIPRLVRARRRPMPRTMTVDDLMGAGFVWLGEEPGREFVLGLVGTFWNEPREFAAFDEPGQAKAAWNFRVIPDGDDRTFVSTETRVRVPDEASRRSFVLYWAAIGPFSAVIRKQALSLIKREAERPAG